MRFEFYADSGKSSCRAIVKLISNTAVKRHLTMKLEGTISLLFHVDKQQYDMNYRDFSIKFLNFFYL